MQKTKDDRRELVLWLALAVSSSVHVLLYLMPWTLPAPLGRPVIDRTRSVVFMDAVGSGEASGEPAGEAASAGPAETTPPSDARTATPTSREPREAAVRRTRRQPVPPAAAPSDEPTTATATETPQAETAESAMTERETAEPQTSETTEAAALPPSELANQLFLEELMRRAPLPGLGDSDGATGSGSGAGGSGCADPVLGTWRARRYDRLLGRHVVFTLRLTARRGEQVEGTILNRSWSGGRSQRSPPRCAPGVSDHTVTMPARGRLVGDSFRLDALSHRRTNHCFDEGLWMYNLDHFTGTLEGDTYRAVNNDGGHERNSPYTFERIRCR